MKNKEKMRRKNRTNRHKIVHPQEKKKEENNGDYKHQRKFKNLSIGSDLENNQYGRSGFDVNENTD